MEMNSKVAGSRLCDRGLMHNCKDVAGSAKTGGSRWLHFDNLGRKTEGDEDDG